MKRRKMITCLAGTDVLSVPREGQQVRTTDFPLFT